MEITKELVKERLELLRGEYEQMVRTAQALSGAIQDNEYWLQILEGEAQASPESVKDVSQTAP